MENYKSKLEEQLTELNEMISRSEKNLARLKNVPNSHIQVSKSNGSYQYYLAETAGCRGKYVKRKDRRIVEKIAQRDYEKRVNKTLKSMKDTLEEFLERYDIDEINELYSKMPPARRILVEPFVETDDDYIVRWMEEHPGMRNPYPQEAGISTTTGIYVRSKSEEIIASLLEKNNVPFQYEARLELFDGYSIYPDFVVLNVRKRKTIYWEHLGLISDPEYARKNFLKIQMYEKGGFEIGDNLIITMESDIYKFDVRDIERKIIRYCR